MAIGLISVNLKEPGAESVTVTKGVFPKNQTRWIFA
jgi:hypothetical protein